MPSIPAPRRAVPVLTGLLAVAGAVLVLALAGAPGEAAPRHADGHADRAAARPTRAAFQDDMRKLWEDHVTWTRLAIVSFAHDLPDLAVTQQRLLRNQADIGDAIKPFYGRAAGNRLTALLEEHIRGAVALLAAAKSGDQSAIRQRTRAWYENGDEVADFLARANPRNWPRRTMRRMMRAHLDQTLREATHRLAGDYAADVRDYEVVHEHILAMADTLSRGIIRQFPHRFR
jgi:hypothetical protein